MRHLTGLLILGMVLGFLFCRLDAAEIAPSQNRPEPLDLSTPGCRETERRLDKMSADEVARYLADPKHPQFSWATSALRRKGEAAIPQWRQLMGRDDLGTRGMEAPEALVALGDKGLPSLIALLKGENRTARRNAAWALMKRGKPCQEAINPLIDLVKGDDKLAAGYAAGALAPNRKDAAAAVPHLIPLAFSLTNTGAPWEAVQAIGLAPEQVSLVVAELAADDTQPLTSPLQIAIGARLLAAADRRGAAALADALGHKNRNVRCATARAIHKLGTEVKSEEVEKALNAAIALDDTRIDAAAALVAIGASAKAAVPGLMQALEQGEVRLLATTDYRYQCRAAEVLATIPESLPVLIEGLTSDKTIVRIGCVWAMPTDKAMAAQVVPKIKRALARSTPGRERELIVERLYKLDPDWVCRAVGRANVPGEWPARHWHLIADAVMATAQAEVAKETNKGSS